LLTSFSKVSFSLLSIFAKARCCITNIIQKCVKIYEKNLNDDKYVKKLKTKE